MKPRHLTWLVTAAALSAGLSAYAQQPSGSDSDPAGQSRGTGSQGGMQGSGSQSGDTGTMGTGSGMGSGSTGETTTTPGSTSPDDRTTTGDDMGRGYDRTGSAEQPKKKKRSFWDRITGRNKHLDAENRGMESPAETGSDTETRPQP